MLRDCLKSEEDSRERIQVFAQRTRIREVCCDPSLLFENYDGESAKREAVMDSSSRRWTADTGCSSSPRLRRCSPFPRRT